MHSSAAYECNKSQYGDKRLDKRYNKIIEQLEARPSTSIPQAFDDFHQTKACYRFWDNDKVSPERILLHHQEETRNRINSHEVILSVQDTTSIDFTRHKSVKGLGYLENNYLQGIFAHTAIAISDRGQPLGILWQKQWVRPQEEYGKKKERNKKPTNEKESQRWIDCHDEINEAMPATSQVIHIADRESDIYDLLSSKRTENQHLLIRFVQNRRVNNNEHKRIKEALESSEAIGKIQINVSRKKGEEPRMASLTLKYAKLEILPPKNRKSSKGDQTVIMTAIRIREEEAPKDVNPIEWLLLTTLSVNSIDDVKRCVQFYTYRWLIERYHYLLKSGCNIEELQLETVQRLMNAIATYCVTGWRVFYSAYLARKEPESDASEIFTRDEIEVLYLKFNPKAKTIPAKPLSLQQAIIMVARIGGFMARKSDGMPGTKTIWRGFLSLEAMVQGWTIARSFLTNISEIKSLNSLPKSGVYG